MRIGIFSGSFNPIHIGHLILANYIIEFTDIDELWFLVTPQSPFKKESTDLIDQDERLKMVELAIADYPKVKVSDFEFTLPIPSYTVNTLAELEKVHPEHTFTLIIGADNWNVFHQWKDYKQIIEKYDIFVYPREGFDIKIPTPYKSRITVLNSPIIEISSTFIRNSIEDGKNVKAFLPEEVDKYIKKEGLYI